MLSSNPDGALISTYTVVLLVPTGIGAAIGGYAGDALPVARAIASVADCLITHPNVLNGAQLYWPSNNTLYVEGFGLDRFAAGNWALRPVRQNRVGLVLDRAIEPDLRLRHLQAADAARATLGIEVTDAIVTDEALGVNLQQAQSGSSWGTLRRPDSLLRAVDRLRRETGATAIAVVARFPDDSPDVEAYRNGCGVDTIAGAEAVISHLVVRAFGLPCAHAPALLPDPPCAGLAPRAAAEELGHTFLPSVLVGLSRAPQFVTHADRIASDIGAHEVDAMVVPAGSCGGSAVLDFAGRGTDIIAVGDNQTVTQVFPEDLRISAIRVKSYLEAIGVLATRKAGVCLQSMSPVIDPIQCFPDAIAKPL